jgi:GntR family transcriptional regulator/MocR family aminotransferase
VDVSIILDTDSPIALRQQIYTEIRAAILGGRFAPALRLPSSRSLADSLSVSRMTVTEAYEQLIAEGYLEPRRGSGTYVCAVLPESSMYTEPAPQRRAAGESRSESPIRFSRYGRELEGYLANDRPRMRGVIRMDKLGPDLTHFPVSLWSKLLARHSRTAKHELFEYASDARGHKPLRAAIAAYLRKARAVQCEWQQIILVNGSQQAVDLCARILIDDGDVVAMESPGYLAAARVFAGQGAQILQIPVDEAGMNVSQLPILGVNGDEDINGGIPKIVYVTPSHQFPTGASLSLPRRLALLNWARQNNALILEDDYDSEYRYGGRPLPSLQGMIPDAPVLYIGTFSKTLFPGLRIGYAVLPERLARVFASAKFMADRQGSSIEQCALADFLAEGHFERHIRRMRKLYGRRRTILREALRRHFGARVTITGDDSGMHLYATFRLDLAENEAYRRALEAGVRVDRVPHGTGPTRNRDRSVPFVFGFAGLTDRSIREGITRLATAWLK